MPAKFIEKCIAKAELLPLELKGHIALVKVVVDVKRRVMIAGTSMHSDAESLLLEQGSEQGDLWGINLYLKKSRAEWIEYDSMINLRPWQENDSRGVDNPEIRQKIREIVDCLVEGP
ncbi:MAG TPA: DUF5674 family protein [Chlamydiales bacterium]|nr:DUF5674 family protein [Chlamydiales bacterium]